MTQQKELIYSLATLQSQINKRVGIPLSGHGISFSEFLVLHYLNEAPNWTMRRIDLAESVGLSASGVTRLLNPMEKNHLVQKEPNSRDARVSLVKLSETGKQVFDEASVSFEQNTELFFKPLKKKQITDLLEALNTLLYR